MSKSHFTLTPCRCPHCRLSRRSLWTLSACFIVIVVITEGGVAYHYLTRGDCIASMLIFTSWLRDLGREMMTRLIDSL